MSWKLVRHRLEWNSFNKLSKQRMFKMKCVQKAQIPAKVKTCKQETKLLFLCKEQNSSVVKFTAESYLYSVGSVNDVCFFLIVPHQIDDLYRKKLPRLYRRWNADDTFMIFTVVKSNSTLQFFPDTLYIPRWDRCSCLLQYGADSARDVMAWLHRPS